MKLDESWLDTAVYDTAEEQFVRALVDKAEGEVTMNGLVSEAAWDTGFEAGVLAAEAGLGRAES